MQDNQPVPIQDNPEPGKPNLFQVIWSVIAALFGVQSGKNRERDFKQGKAGDYILVYVVLVVAMVLGMVVTVNMVLDAASK
ncbi:hypothetical protein S7S_09765 [Isoalcanivorax pacificus W11-5]|uniref:DUF2970 domain-containing protein n=1 Tax=Isoalcanivorax pacificus W11-5 TaxID=391936 RepID=A0A0B4XNL4_9GAMM|nr:DUF2970 domain-containing protein [Isoalcanivorax pacificus]AJD48365.1 hypothetical protein S7S_09765 [Isoalcanivorax pacificus W11-5]